MGKVEMATLSELVEAVAEVEGMDPSTVALFARTVREAGLIRTGGRGLSAAQMSCVDAANLLIAVNASLSVRDAPNTVATFRVLKAKCRSDFHLELPRLRRDKFGWITLRDASFGQALEQLLEAGEAGAPQRFLSVPMPINFYEALGKGEFELRITFNKPVPYATISFFTAKQPLSELAPLFFSFADPKPIRETDAWMLGGRLYRRVYPYDRQETTEIGYRTINAVSKLLRQEIHI
jgi:hypothetical protein